MKGELIGSEVSFFPISIRAVGVMEEFIDVNGEDESKIKYDEVRDLIERYNPKMMGVFTHTLKLWGGDEKGMRGQFFAGFAMTYELLRAQAAATGQFLPTVTPEVADTFIVDVEACGTSYADYAERRRTELKQEDAIFFYVLQAFVKDKDVETFREEGLFNSLGALVAYDLLKKQAYADGLEQAFELS